MFIILTIKLCTYEGKSVIRVHTLDKYLSSKETSDLYER